MRKSKHWSVVFLSETGGTSETKLDSDYEICLDEVCEWAFTQLRARKNFIGVKDISVRDD
jgi:hypothetical protein